MNWQINFFSEGIMVLIKSPILANISRFSKVGNLTSITNYLIKNKNVWVQKSQIRFHENIGSIVALQYSWLDLPLFLPLAVIKVMKARDHPFKTSACLRGGGVSPCADGQKVTVHKNQKSPS